MKTYWYILNLNPVPWRVGPAGAARNATTGKMKGYVGRDQELYNYQQAVKAELARMNPTLVDGQIKVTMWFWREIEEYKTEKSRKSQSNIADGTNLYKGTEDACQKILFDNDRANVEGRWFVVEQAPGVSGRVIIRVEQIPKGILSNSAAIEELAKAPEEIFAVMAQSPHEQLALAIDAPNTSLASDDKKYADADEIF